MNGIVYSHISIELKTPKSEIFLVRREYFFTVWVLWKCCSGEFIFSPLGYLKLDWREEQRGEWWDAERCVSTAALQDRCHVQLNQHCSAICTRSVSLIGLTDK